MKLNKYREFFPSKEFLANWTTLITLFCMGEYRERGWARLTVSFPQQSHTRGLLQLALRSRHERLCSDSVCWYSIRLFINSLICFNVGQTFFPGERYFPSRGEEVVFFSSWSRVFVSGIKTSLCVCVSSCVCVCVISGGPPPVVCGKAPKQKPKIFFFDDDDVSSTVLFCFWVCQRPSIFAFGLFLRFGHEGGERER